MATTSTVGTLLATETTKNETILPDCRILIRSKDGVEVFSIPSSSSAANTPPTPPTLQNRQYLLRGATTFQVYSPNGDFVYLHQSSVGVIRCPLKDGNGDENNRKGSVPFLADSQQVQIMTVSPLGTYLLTWERWRQPATAKNTTSAEGEDAAAQSSSLSPNLKVWRADNGAFVWGETQKNLKREGWPYLQWTHDEKFAFLMTSNELRVYQGHDLAAIAATGGGTSTTNNNNSIPSLRYVDRIRCPGVVSFSLPNLNNPNKTLMMIPSSDNEYFFTTFCSKTKDQPARISLHVYPPPPTVVPPTSVAAKKPSSNYPALVSKSSHQADECHIYWNPKGDTCLASLQASVDTTGESYYGSSTLVLLRRDATEAILVPLPNATTNPSVSDVSWMPNPHTPPCFLVISGKMPTTTSLHHGVTADPLYMLGQGHRNTSAWAPHGRFFALAGFGNLAGGVSLWDRNKLKPIDSTAGPVTAPCTVGWSWSPDSRLIFTSITSPRRNVDNGVRIFRYNGAELTNHMPWNNVQYYHPDKLLQASFVPSEVQFPDRPQSPKPRRSGNETTPPADQTASTTSASASTPIISTSTATPAPVAAPKGRYVPPSARGRPSDGTSLADRMRREAAQSSLGATKAVAVVAAKSSVPGMAPVKKAIPGLNPPSTTKSNSKKTKKPKPKNPDDGANAAANATSINKLANAPAVAAESKPTASSAVPAEPAETDPEKRARKLKKTLKQIEDLKSRPASEWNDDQQKKVASEQQLREELAKLGF